MPPVGPITMLSALRAALLTTTGALDASIREAAVEVEIVVVVVSAPVEGIVVVSGVVGTLGIPAAVRAAAVVGFILAQLQETRTCPVVHIATVLLHIGLQTAALIIVTALFGESPKTQLFWVRSQVELQTGGSKQLGSLLLTPVGHATHVVGPTVKVVGTPPAGYGVQ